MAFARDTYTSAGEATYTITFPYLAAGHVNLFVDGVSKTYTLDDSTTLRPDVAVIAAQVVLITRTSNQSARLVDYVDASVFKAATLDDDLLQAFYVSQEALDESTLVLGLDSTGLLWDAESKKMTNLVAGGAAGYAVEYAEMVAYVAAVGGVTAPTDVTDDNKVFHATSGGLMDFGDSQLYRLNRDLDAATIGPDVRIERTNAAGTAADNDLIGAATFVGEDDAAAAVNYARLQAKIIDASAADEEAELNAQVMIGGTLTEVASFDLNGIDVTGLYIGGVSQPTIATTLAADNAWTGSQRGTMVQLTDAATVAVDFNTEQNMYVTLTASRTIGQPSNQTDGQSGFLIVEQDVTGGWTPSFHADWDFGTDGAPTVDTTANKKAVFAYFVDWDTTIHTRFIGDF